MAAYQRLEGGNQVSPRTYPSASSCMHTRIFWHHCRSLCAPGTCA